MATARPRPSDLDLLPRPSSDDFSQHSTDSSMFFSILPSVVKSRIPRIPSIRRSVTMYVTASRRRVTTRSGSSTPSVSGYTSAMVLSGGSRALITTSGEEMTEYFVEGMSSEDEYSQGTQSKRHSMEFPESKSGIAWKYANQGLNLLGLACEESSAVSRNPNLGNSSFARHLYIHAITYLLRALPEEMTNEEQLSIRSSLPFGIIESLDGKSGAGGNQESSPRPEDEEPSLLHKTLATTIIQFFIFVQFILPYFKYLLTSAYQYDRTHKISERVFSQSIETVDSLGKGGLTLTAAIYNMGDGKVGKVITEAASWVLEGVTGGIHDGFGEGLVLMGAKKAGAGGMERRR